MAQSNDGSPKAGAPEGGDPRADLSQAGSAPAARAQEQAASAPAVSEPAFSEEASPLAAPGKPGPAKAARPPAGKRRVPPKAAPLPRPSKSARHPAVTILSGLFTFLLFVAIGGGLGIWYAEKAFYAPGPLTAEKVVLIPRGAGVRDMGEILEREGVISNWLMFVVGQRMTREDAKFKAGEYVFRPGQSAASVIDTLASGKVVQHQITIPEGLTSQQIVKRLMENELLTGTPAVPQEGTLLPETYQITRGQSREDVLQRMAEEQRKVLAAVWAKRAPDLPVRSPQELVTLASIVEKETGQSDERAKVAAVFVNRLGKKMKLQSDPTIIYGIVGGKGSLGRPISKADIATPTAYNTYAIDGLPPGPICNPGRAALTAAANPAKTRDLYFVADGTGGHAFAETLNDHNKNVARWRAIEQGQTPPPAPGQPATPAPAAGN
ncbi:endolytic transglycosylase MltG [Xanthobacter autotrophicus DSM 431]|uniref:endolytic transglycosylase MltG n=1 Tax=Xanthobacter nonsaccharivorans TaxID=3119912 RepID=UPI003726DA09